MNLPNKLTMLRILMIPFFVAFLFLGKQEPWAVWVAVVLFISASVTDLLDGRIARKYGLVTDFGKFMDPLADKLMVCSALIVLVNLQVFRDVGPFSSGLLECIFTIVVLIIIAREFAISGFRLVASGKGQVISAGILGKIKTNFQIYMTVGVMLLLLFDWWPLTALVWLLILLALVFTLWSLVDYFVKNRGVLKG